MKELIAEEENVIDITVMEEDNIVLLDVEYQMGCTPEIHDVLVDFYNMGMKNTQCDSNDSSLFIPEGVIQEDIMELLCKIGFAEYFTILVSGPPSVKTVYNPTMLYGIQGRELCQAVAQVIEVNQKPAATTLSA